MNSDDNVYSEGGGDARRSGEPNEIGNLSDNDEIHERQGIHLEEMIDERDEQAVRERDEQALRAKDKKREGTKGKNSRDLRAGADLRAEGAEKIE